MKVEIFDKCRTESATRLSQGEFYPLSTVSGISTDAISVVSNPGDGNSIAFSFVEGIADNTDIYTDNGDNTATVEFCAQVGLYFSSTLINFAEVKLTYTVDLTTSFTSLTGYTVTEAKAFADAADELLTFDGTLIAYFCNPNTYAELTDDGSLAHQGSIHSVCFKVPNGQFEIQDIIDLSIRDAIDSDPTQVIIANSNIQSPSYAEKTCYDIDGSDTNICVVSFVLTAGFYDFHTLTLSGTGSVLLEFGDASGSRRTRQLRQGPASPRRLNTKTRGFTVKASEFAVERNVPLKKMGGSLASNGSVIVASILAVAVLGLAALVQTVVKMRGKYRNAKIKERYIMKQKFHENEECYEFSTKDDELFRDSFLNPSKKGGHKKETTSSALFPETSAFSMLGASPEESHTTLTSQLMGGGTPKISFVNTMEEEGGNCGDFPYSSDRRASF